MESNYFRYPRFTAGSLNFNRNKPQVPTVVHDLYVSLEDIAEGCTKKVKINKKVLNPDGRTTELEQKVLTIEVKPGWKAGTKITFPKEGSQSPNSIPADIAFIIRDKPHKLFKREGSNIRYILKVTLKEALCGVKVKIPLLSGDTKLLLITAIMRPHFIHKIRGQGLPLPKEPSKKGDLIVGFDISFPEKLTKETKEALKKILP